MPRSTKRRLYPVLLSAVLALSAAACEGIVAVTPTSPTPAAVTETFSGTIIRGAASVHSFTVSVTGTVTIGLTAVEPLTTMALGLGIGTWDGTVCTTISQNEGARAGADGLNGTATAGNYCVRVFDSGNVPSEWTVNYTVTVAHP